MPVSIAHADTADDAAPASIFAASTVAAIAEHEADLAKEKTAAAGAPARVMAPQPVERVKKVQRGANGPLLSLEQVMTIKRELFVAPDQRRDILAGYGLTGLEWRLAERTLARDLDDKSVNIERVRKLLGRA